MRWHFHPLRSLTESEVRAFLSEHPFSVIHVDAVWDGYAPQLAKKLVAASAVMPDVGFATMDCDAEQEYAKTLGLLNTPTALYFRGTDLVASVIGVTQDVASNIGRLRAGEPIDNLNQLSRG